MQVLVLRFLAVLSTRPLLTSNWQLKQISQPNGSTLTSTTMSCHLIHSLDWCGRMTGKPSYTCMRRLWDRSTILVSFSSSSLSCSSPILSSSISLLPSSSTLTSQSTRLWQLKKTPKICSKTSMRTETSSKRRALTLCFKSSIMTPSSFHVSWRFSTSIQISMAVTRLIISDAVPSLKISMPRPTHRLLECWSGRRPVKSLKNRQSLRTRMTFQSLISSKPAQSQAMKVAWMSSQRMTMKRIHSAPKVTWICQTWAKIPMIILWGRSTTSQALRCLETDCEPRPRKNYRKDDKSLRVRSKISRRYSTKKTIDHLI